MDALEIFRIVATEFSDIPDETEYDEEGKVVVYGMNTYFELWKDQISQSRFGSSYEKALAYLVAHKLKMAGHGKSDSAGQIAETLRVSSYSEGETSISFASGSSSGSTGQVDSEYGYTVYGLEFLQLRNNAIIPILNAGEGWPHG